MSTHRKIIIFSILSIFSLFLLAISLSNLTFMPGKPLPLDWEVEQTTGGVSMLPGGEVIFNILRGVFYFCWVLFFITLIYNLLSKEGRKRILLAFLRTLPLLIIVLLLFKFLQNYLVNRPEPTPTPEQAFNLTPGEIYPLPEGEEFIPTAPTWGIWLASLGLSLLVVSIIVFFIWLYSRNKHQQIPLQSLAQEAQNALDEIEKGGDLRNVVIRCYYEMSRVLNDQKGLRRFPDMTPHEFLRKLEEKGIPGQPSQQLTSLFEEVRYGSKPVGKLEEQRAVASLSAIVNFCQNKP